MSLTSERLRKEWSVNDAERDKGLTTPEGIERFDDIRYGEDPIWNVLDVYRPMGMKELLPVIVSVHGGGWVYGDKELYQFYCMSLAGRGFAVVNFTYRLAPEVQFPAPLYDTNSVMVWMCKNAEKYGFDPENIFMVGDSAGGHLAALYAAIVTDPSYAENYDFGVPEGLSIKGLGLNCGAYDPLHSDPIVGTAENRELMEDFLPDGGSAKEIELINATAHVTAAFPPVFLMTAFGDFCRPQAPIMAEALVKNGVHCECKTYGSKEEPLYHVFHITVQEKAGQLCNDEECAFFRRLMNE